MRRPPPFQRFLDAHREEVLRFLVAVAGREDAEDCFQETFLAALRAYPRLRDDGNLRAWVLTIAHRKAIDAHRARARRAVPVAEPPEPRGAGAGAPAAGEGGDAWAAVRELPPKQRHAVALRYAADLTHGQIAATMGTSEEAARRNVHEGLRRLREAMA